MQNQMEAKLSSMGLKSPSLNSPNARNFSGGANQRQSLAVESPSSSFLSPDAANTLAQQRARLKANAAHRISAPGTLAAAADGRGVWAQSQLGQVAEVG